MNQLLRLLPIFSALYSSVFCNTCKPKEETFLKTEGNILLVGLFDLHHGRHCQLVRKGGQQQVQAALTAINWINNNSYIDDVKIGFLALDTCSDIQTTIKQIIQGLTESKFLNSCDQHRLAGFLGPSNSIINTEVLNFLQPLSIPYIPIKITHLHSEIQVLIEILVQFNWFKVAVLSISEELRKDFYEKASESNICITVSSLLTHSSDNFFKRVVQKSTNVIILLGTEVELQESMRLANINSPNKFYWLVAGLMPENIELNLNIYKNVIRSLLIVESSEILNDEKYENLIETIDDDDKLCVNCRDISDPSVRATISGILRYSRALNRIQNEECNSENKQCSSFKKILNKQLMKKLKNNLEDKFDEMAFQSGNATVWSYQQDKSQDNAVFHQVGYFSQNQLKIDTKKLDILQPMGGGWFKIPHFHCERKCNCLNEEIVRVKNNTENGIWKSATWVTVCVTISSIGIIVSATILTFILYYMCSGISLEGHHGFMLLTLIGIIILYMAVLPYAFYPTEIVCALRTAVLGLGYAAVFSPIIARCLMLATSGTLGLAGHINGIVQTALYCFIFGVQVALSAQYWWLNAGSHILYESHCPARCDINQNGTVSILIYNMFLLAMLLFLTPFCIKTRRNYREGLFFHLASLVTFAVWITWFTLYFVFSFEWTEPAMCLGFVSTATVVLVIIFLPRVYKIATANSRNNSKMRLRSLDQLTASIRSNSTSRNLYSSVKNNLGSMINTQTLKDEIDSDVYDDSSLPTITHL